MTDTSPAMRVLVADDQVLVRAGVAALLAQMPGFRCVGSAENGAQCLAACAALAPDILLLDLQMPDADGLAVARALRPQHPALRVVILTSHASAAHARQALAEGVAGFVSKDFVLDELAQALRCVAAGRPYISPDVAMAAVQAPAVPADPLTSRQREVLRGLARGLGNKQIARDLGLSVKTVEFHRSALIQRLDLHDVASLTRYAVSQGLV
ncbi:response regulator [Pseudaquabacterium pictum]|uniref:DNA-binding response regulator n=1 Tax=Pseudaquabacterium pictum TaxID=2315236 RepID=A0A480AX01_9BURK|nr:response regulator transcription factor [Rubrivivax pictus]GCL65911.1 DNA-binding response regulator [Rubrivivax pictus]